MELKFKTFNNDDATKSQGTNKLPFKLKESAIVTRLIDSEVRPSEATASRTKLDHTPSKADSDLKRVTTLDLEKPITLCNLSDEVSDGI